MMRNRVVEYVFFFGLLAAAFYVVWNVFSPFLGALAFSAIIVTICYPIYCWFLHYIPGGNRSLSAFLTTLIVIVVVVLPVLVLGSFLLREALSVYTLFNNGSQFSIEQSLIETEQFIQSIIPGFSLDITSYIQQAANFVATNIATIFTGTASTLFLFFIALIGIFYLFRDGKEFTKYLVRISPLPDDEDEIILSRLARSVRSVTLGIVLIAIIQGVLTGIGLSIFGFERAVLWGSVAAIGALIPGVGTSIVFIPAIIYLIVGGDYLTAAGVALWGTLAVGIIDNFLGPYLMSRGNSLHPFVVLVSVLGGIILFGPIGFILGPVSVSLLFVLLEIYSIHLGVDETGKT